LQEDPSHLESRLLLAESYIAQGDAASRGVGMKELSRAGAFHPEAAAPPRRVGELWMESEDYADAAQSFARAADLDPGDETHLEKAAEAYERLKAPERVRLYRQRAAEIAALKQEAARLEQAAAAAPQDAGLVLARARLCLRLHWYREAEAGYRRVLHLRPGHAEAAREASALERLIRTREEEGQVITGPG
jgi:Flp pilus assembly protein TadD